MDGSTLPRVVYIGGAGRSGSTLTERLFGQLPGACAVGEVVYLWERGIAEGNRCGCGESFRRCPFWHDVITAAFGGWDELDVARVVELRAAVDRTRFIPWLLAPTLRPAFSRKLAEYLSYAQRLYRAIGTVAGCDLIVDSSKNAAYAFCLSNCAELDLRVVHIVRDSRAVAHSLTRKVRRPETLQPSYMATSSPGKAAAKWNYENGALQLLARTGTPTLRVRYEDLVSDPEAALIRIAAFSGSPVDTGALSFVGSDESGRWADLSVAHTASGNPMRFATGRIPIRLDDEWRTRMTAAHRGAVTLLTLPLLAHYGYLTA